VKPIEAARALVSVSELAERLSGAAGVRAGREELFLCPLHDDHNPSLRVDPHKGLWYCDPCALGGDVVELARRAWGHPNNGRGSAGAAAYLLLEFGYHPPQRPPAWHRKQDRQRHTREAIEQTKKNIVARRLFRHLILPLVDTIEDESERNRELERAWSEFRRLVA
jgi:hypothetical protein